MLRFLGSRAAAEPYVVASKVFTVLYFSYFIVVLPLLSYCAGLTPAWPFRKPRIKRPQILANAEVSGVTRRSKLKNGFFYRCVLWLRNLLGVLYFCVAAACVFYMLLEYPVGWVMQQLGASRRGGLDHPDNIVFIYAPLRAVCDVLHLHPAFSAACYTLIFFC